ncbi:MAG: hypothetical protein BalsKO_12980 [Balneolaceae bacterium]
MILLRSSLIVFVGLVLLNNCWAQDSNLIKREFVLVNGYSPKSIVFLGKTANASTTFVKLEYRKQTNKSFFGNPLYYQFGIIPFIEFDYPKRDEGGRSALTKGFGISPFGLGISNPISKKIDYSVYSYSGIILVDDRFPTDKGRKLNYTFSLSFDTIFKTSEYISLSLGYKFHHISNAQTGTENPGIDSNFLTISLIISK